MEEEDDGSGNVMDTLRTKREKHLNYTQFTHSRVKGVPNGSCVSEKKEIVFYCLHIFLEIIQEIL